MIIRILSSGKCIQYIEIEEAVPTFNLNIQSLSRDKEIIIYTGNHEEHIVAETLNLRSVLI